MKDENIQKKLALLNNEKAALIWLSGIEKKIEFTEINNKWGIATSLLYRPLPNGINCRQSLDDLGLIKTEWSKGNVAHITSDIDWLCEYFKYKEGEEIYGRSIRSTIPIDEMNDGAILKVFNSDAFRKGCMYLDDIINEIKGKDERYNTFPWGEKASKKQKHKKYFWSGNINWGMILIRRLRALSLCKAFNVDPLYFRYYYDGEIHKFIGLEQQLGLPESIGLAIWKRIQSNGYKIPDQVKPYFTLDTMTDKFVEEANGLKRAWPDAWENAKKRLNLKEEI